MARYSKAYRSREEGTTSVARVYADINDKRPAEYWDYENLQVQVGCRQRSVRHSSSRCGRHTVKADSAAAAVSAAFLSSAVGRSG